MARFSISYRGGDGNDIVLTAIDAGPPQFTYLLTDGGTGPQFDEDILITNPNDSTAPVTLMFSKPNGERVIATRALAPRSHLTIHVDEIRGLEDVPSFSTQVTSDAQMPLVVERSMFWNASHTAGHTAAAVDTPAPDWYFAVARKAASRRSCVSTTPARCPRT